MQIYGRVKDFVKDAEILAEAFYRMSSDFAHVYQMLGIGINEEKLANAYMQLAEGPTVFEEILIKEGKISRDDVARNAMAQYLYSKLTEIIDGPAETYQGGCKNDRN